MCYNEIYDGETINQASNTKNLQRLRCPQENINHMLDEHKENFESQPNHEISIEMECKDVKPHVNLLMNEKTHTFQPNCHNHKIEVELKCKNVKPTVDLLVYDMKVNKGIHEFQLSHEDEIEIECKYVKPNVNTVVPVKANHWLYQLHISIKI